MNPQKNYEDIDTETARAFMELFIQHGDLFKFPVDSGVSDDEELQAFIIKNDYQYTEDGKSTLCITGINQTKNVNKISNILRDMGLEIIKETENNDYHESIGDYTSNTITAFAPKDIDAEWNIPHLLVYGSLSPEIKEAFHYAFGDKYEYYNVRNHYVVRGEQLTLADRDELNVAIGNVHGFEDDKAFNKSQLNMSDFI